MANSKWSEIDIENELRRLESMLSTSLFMNLDDDNEHSIAMELIGMSLSRIRELKTACGVDHA
ncbi:Uncharacterised protein [Klebsiella variicola]|uniref:hypothetical protein n=1 Tax=Klebsiella TaxID=570 RepID=UPI000C9AD17F|nr:MULTISPECIES: hypothetical protein [Klebsiella]MBG2644315.1 hypothetical protein [Klebsiella michiganensis]MBX4796550.1 hypothetical protein [Klebsiella michiganensis]SQC46605.1 Uncharacterised protein [Klebsiella pneumoniae]STW44957.1 Uncharacterised protein [Klebsiella variicola]HBY9728516.1 hypothetical protein [Klebsiella pneumoniae]